MFLEVIAKSIDDVLKINNSKADRIELCEDLEHEGLTPNFNLIFEAINKSQLPVNVIVRNNQSLDFVFTEEEKQKMIEDIKKIAKTNANGIVIGSLTPDMKIDTDFIKQVIPIKGNLEITFHKAFDLLKDKIVALKILNDFKINNVLTSGGKNLEQNYSTLEKLVKNTSYTKILIGGGVNINNFKDCIKISENIHIGTAARTINN